MDLRLLQKIQRDTGFSIDFLEKTFHLTSILSAISGHKNLGRMLTLKGGTALNFVYLDVPRLSVDLDFNFTGALEKQRMFELRKVISREIVELGRSLGYRVSKRPESYIMERFVLKYRKLSGLQDSLRLEINYLERVPFVSVVRKRFKNIFGGEKLHINTYTVEEIAAMKTKAMAERLYARDIFDVYNISGLEINCILLRKLMILYLLMARKEPGVENLLGKIRRYDEKEMWRVLRAFVRLEEGDLNPGLIKKETESFYRKIFVLDDLDLAFLKSLREGELNLKILFGNLPFNMHSENHPGLLWALELG
ncbi:MAG: nucleotidyl transferase AbiEii/AbiGii toxin family protein [Candidatus Aminicenantales bacterium]